MPCILKVRISAARNLPVMDRTTDLTDAYVEIRFADFEGYRTQICRRTLNPVWNEDFRFEVSEDSDLQNEPLELKVMDHDQITQDEAIGLVFIDINPLLAWNSPGQISGWFPIYDSLLGVRGEVHAQAKLQFFGDINPFKDSSAGVQFYSTSNIPPNYQIGAVLGFVSSLEHDDDPEYHWKDSFRSPRKSNESRALTMFRLSGNCRRELGKKVLELNGNAVLGCKQYFDLEADQKTITARSIGTAVKLITSEAGATSSMVKMTPLLPSLSTKETKLTNFPSSPDRIIPLNSSPPCFTDDDRPFNEAPPPLQLPSSWRAVDPIFLTVTQYPMHSVTAVGGFVCATSIKVFDNDARDFRETWWTELRDEIKSHAIKLKCSHVLGYTEEISIRDDIALLFCCGTAANLDLTSSRFSKVSEEPEIVDELSSRRQSARNVSQMMESSTSANFPSVYSKEDSKGANFGCRLCHISYNRSDSPFPMAFSKCHICKKKYVPEIALFTIEPPPELLIIGNGVLIGANGNKVKVGYSRPTDVSDAVPFIHYDLHRQLMYKLRIYGLNAVFGLKIQISLGDGLITAIATGTAVHARALSVPAALKLVRNIDIVNEEDVQMMEVQKKLMAISEMNRKKIEDALFSQNDTDKLLDSPILGSDSENDSDCDEDAIKKGQKMAMVVQIDDETDEDLVLFMDDQLRDGYNMCTTETLPIGTNNDSISKYENIQMFTLITQTPIQVDHHPNRQLAAVLKAIYQQITFQTSHMSPCLVSKISYKVQVSKEDFVQLCLTAMVQGKDELVLQDIKAPIISHSNSQSEDVLLSIPEHVNSPLRRALSDNSVESVNQDDLVRQLEGEDMDDQSISPGERDVSGRATEVHFRSQESLVSVIDINHTIDPRTVEIVPLSYVPGQKIVSVLSSISLHFIKETNLVFDSRSGMNGLGGFSFIFMQEIMAVIRAHTIALGGNALIGYTMDQFLFEEVNNQGYGLVSISGDVVKTVAE